MARLTETNLVNKQMTEEDAVLIGHLCGIHYRLLVNENTIRNNVMVMRERPEKNYADVLNISAEFYGFFRVSMMTAYYMPPENIGELKMWVPSMKSVHLMNIAAERCVLKKYRGNPNVVTDVTKI